jgi:hypothetical protein
MQQMHYIFMVGFPRSGTTLAQSIVMCDERVYSFPETHLFTKGLRFNKLPDFLSNLWTTWYCYQWVKNNFSENYIFYSTSKTKLIRKFFNFIEDKAQQENKSIILEKTPAHLKKIDDISAIFEKAQFIHVVRSYRGAIPSIIKAARQWKGNDSQVWNMQRWLADVYTSTYYTQNKANHVLINYDDFVTDRTNVIFELNKHLSLQIKDVSNEQLARVSKLIVEPNETWKSNNLQGISPSPIKLDTNYAMEPFINYLNKLK